MSSTTCPQCRHAKPERYPLCWKCHVSELQAQAYTTGFAEGFAKAKAEAPRLPHEALDLARIRALLQVAHPDKHRGSAAATECTQWLLRQRELIEASAS